MALNELLVHLDASESSRVRLNLAMQLANRHSTRLIALFVDQWSLEQTESRATAELGLASARDIDRLDRLVHNEIGLAAARLRAQLETFRLQRDLRFEWHRTKDDRETAIHRFLPYADLCVLGHDSAVGPYVDGRFSERLVFDTATPVIFVPTGGAFTSIGRRIMVAWDGSRTAARALNDAMALVEGSDHTTLINVDSGNSMHVEATLQRTAWRLKRHGVPVQAMRIPLATESIADALLAKAHELDADLLVAGAFGHPRIKERVFGGVTCHLLDRMTLPILMSH